ncbi:MAG: ATP-binding cassette domain-containing protein [Lysobacterales bacterium]
MIEFSARHAFGEFELDIRFESRARTLALFGDSGAGKTSVLNMIAGLLAPGHGRIVLDGEVLFDSATGTDVPARARRIGYVFQEGRLFPHLDVRRNLLYGVRARGLRDAPQFTATVELLALEPLLGRRPGTLSGGERQRVAIGRALLAEPRALLLDEPLTGLHRAARAQVLEHLARMRRELGIFTVLVSHHEAEVLALADEIVQVSGGEVESILERNEFEHRIRSVVFAGRQQFR